MGFGRSHPACRLVGRLAVVNVRIRDRFRAGPGVTTSRGCLDHELVQLLDPSAEQRTRLPGRRLLRRFPRECPSGHPLIGQFTGRVLRQSPTSSDLHAATGAGVSRWGFVLRHGCRLEQQQQQPDVSSYADSVPSGVSSSKVQWLLSVSRSRPEAVTYVRKIVVPARTKTVICASPI